MKGVMKKLSIKTLRKSWVEIGSILAVLVFAAILTIIRPFDGDVVSYFSDILTPLVLVVGLMFVILGLKRVV